MYFVYTGSQQYSDIESSKEEFKKIERIKVSQLQTYDQYGGHGFGLYFMPSVLSVFFNNTNLFNELSAQVDVGPKLNIYDSFKGKQVFSLKPGRWLDFSGIMLIFGSLMALYYGYDAFRHKEYLKFLASIYGHLGVYRFIWLSRMILLGLYFLFVFFCAILLLKLKGINLTGSQFVHLLIFLLIMLLMLVFFFTLGTIAATRSKYKIITFVLIWFGFAYFLPVFINIVIEGRSRDIASNYKSESDKLKILMGFEGEAAEKASIERLRYLQGFLNEIPGFVKLKELVEQEYKVSNKIEKEKEPQRLEKLKSLQNVLVNQIELEKKEVGKVDVFKSWVETRKKVLGRLLEKEAPGPRRASMENALKVLGKLEEEISGGEKNWLDNFLNELSRLKEKMAKVGDEMLRQFPERQALKIQNYESDLEKKIRSNVRHFQLFSSLVPSAFYLSVNNEISSRGYRNVIDFHKYSTNIKKEFVKFHTKKRREELAAQRRGDERGGVESFIKKDENIFTGKSQLPWNFGLGLLLSIVWNIVLAFWSYRLYKLYLFTSPKEKIVGIDELEIDLKKGDSNVVLSKEQGISDHLYNVLSGQNKGFKGTITHDGENLADINKRIKFVYLCHPEDLPGDIKPRDFVRFLLGGTSEKPKDKWKKINEELRVEERGKKYFINMKDEEKGHILLESICSQEKEIYIHMIYDFVRGMPPSYVLGFITRLDSLKSEGNSILYLTNDVFLARKIGDFISFLKKDIENKEMAFVL
jgi:hypothetical protein